MVCAQRPSPRRLPLPKSPALRLMSPASRRGRRLLPAFLKVRGLVKQHLDSYNHLVDVEMRQIVEANSAVRCDQHPDFFLNFTNVYLGEPSLEEEYDSVRTWDAGKLTPQECRLRDITYSAPIKVDVEYSYGGSGAQPKTRRKDCLLYTSPSPRDS